MKKFITRALTLDTLVFLLALVITSFTIATIPAIHHSPLTIALYLLAYDLITHILVALVKLIYHNILKRNGSPWQEF